jgi:predicted lipoprotein with Yx(FWY)xxD motif
VDRAAARNAAAEPAFVGLIGVPGPRPAVPPATEADPAASRHRLRRVVTAAAAIVSFAAIVLVVSASESRDVLARAGGLPSPSVAPSTSSAPPPFLSVGTGPTAGLLVRADGKVLYYNDQDGPPPGGVPACVGACAQVWTPLEPMDGVPLVAGPGVTGFVYTTVRADGSTQITFNGHPLYVFTVDGPGNVTGNGLIDAFNGRAYSWHAASATDTPVIPSPSASPTLPDLSTLSPSLLPTPLPTVSSSGSPSPSPTR